MVTMIRLITLKMGASIALFRLLSSPSAVKYYNDNNGVSRHLELSVLPELPLVLVLVECALPPMIG